MGAFELGSNLRAELERIANVHGLEFIRIFGSGLHSVDKARDIDLVIDRIISELPRFSELVSELSKVFSKPVDLIELRRQLPPHRSNFRSALGAPWIWSCEIC